MLIGASGLPGFWSVFGLFDVFSKISIFPEVWRGAAGTPSILTLRDGRIRAIRRPPLFYYYFDEPTFREAVISLIFRK